MGFGEAIKTCFTKYGDFKGRARRSEFWWFFLFTFLVQLPFSVVVTTLFLTSLSPAVVSIIEDGELTADIAADINWLPVITTMVLSTVVYLILLIPSLSVWARRLHDMGQTGHWLWLNLVNLGIVPLVLAFMDSEPGTNRWGMNPRASDPLPGAYVPPTYPEAPAVPPTYGPQ